MHFLAADMDASIIDLSFCNAQSWHNSLLNKGLVKGGTGQLSDIASRCCDMVNIKWSGDDEWDEEIVDTVEAIILQTRGVYSSLIGTLVIVLHEHTAELQLITQSHVTLHEYSQLPIIICRSLYHEFKQEPASPSLMHCAPSETVDSMTENGCWSPYPTSGRAQLRLTTTDKSWCQTR